MRQLHFKGDKGEADIYDCVCVTSTDGWGGKVEEQSTIPKDRGRDKWAI